MRSTFKAMLLSTAAIAVNLEADQPVVPEVPEVVEPVVPANLPMNLIIASVLAKMVDAPCNDWMGMKVCYKKRVTIEGDDGEYFAESI